MLQLVQNKPQSLINDLNPLAQYKELLLEKKRLEADIEAYKAEIFRLMDEMGDVLVIGDFKAERKLIVQTRADMDKIKAVLGDDYESYTKECEVIKLSVI